MDLIKTNHTPASTKLKGGYTVFTLSVCPSVRLSVCGQNGVRSVSSTILTGSISYLHILSSNFRRCFAFKACCKIQTFNILANSFLLGIQYESTVRVIMRQQGVSSERRRFSCSSYWYNNIFVKPQQQYVHLSCINKTNQGGLMPFTPRPHLSLQWCLTCVKLMSFWGYDNISSKHYLSRDTCPIGPLFNNRDYMQLGYVYAITSIYSVGCDYSSMPTFSGLTEEPLKLWHGWVITSTVLYWCDHILTLIARLMGPTWGPSGADRTHVGPMWAPWTLLSWCTLLAVLLYW